LESRSRFGAAAAGTPEWDWQQRVEELVNAKDPGAVFLLIQGIGRPGLREEALQRLFGMGDDVGAEALSKQGPDWILDHMSMFDRRADLALRRLGPADSQRFVGRLMGMLHDRSDLARDWAAGWLKEAHPPEALPALLDAAQHDTYFSVRIKAAEAVARIEPLKAVAPLAAIMHEPYPGAKSMGAGLAIELAEELLKIDDDRAEGALVAWLTDPNMDKWDRWNTVQALQRSPLPRAARVAKVFSPKSPLENTLPVGIIGASLLLLGLTRRRGGLTMAQRLAIAGAGSIATLVGAAALFPIWWMGGGVRVVWMLLLLSILPAIAIWVLRALLKWTPVSPLAVGVGSALGLLAAVWASEYLFWYRHDGGGWRGVLVRLSLPGAAALAASYWPRLGFLLSRLGAR
jgi:hypothetical protein